MRKLKSFTEARFYGSVAALNVATLLILIAAFRPVGASSILSNTGSSASTQLSSNQTAISGRPVRITVPRLGIDLPVDEGFYNSQTGSWTLSGYRAQFATMTSLANDQSGNTFIYGHNNPHVFGPLKNIQVGDVANVYTDNGHQFAYTFVAAQNDNSNDLSVFRYQGSPILTVQTCSGSMNEWRRMYRFNLTWSE